MYYMCTGGDIKTNRVVVVLPEEDHFQAVSEKCRDEEGQDKALHKGSEDICSV